jgi:poly-gamma-glutamate synthesis protein (capsule biosynthesis protein)
MEISFVGDVSISGKFRKNIENNIPIICPYLLEQIKLSDYSVFNMEGPVTVSKNITDKNIDTSSPLKTVEFLKNSGFNFANLANNHIFDCGIQGFSDTVLQLEKHRFYYNGAGFSLDEASKIIYLSKDNMSVAVVSITVNDLYEATSDNYGIFSIEKNKKLLIQNIANAKSNADYVVVNFHGGKEFTLYPSPKKRKLLKKILLNNPVDVIVAHHSHVFQGYEEFQGKYIFYSLGNFIFDIDIHDKYDYTDKSAILKLLFSKEKINISFLPVLIDKCEGKVKKCRNEFIEHILKLSDFNDYFFKWSKEAHRVFFEISKQSAEKKTSNSEVPIRSKHIIDLLFSLKFYKSLFLILNSHMRDIFVSAMIYKIFIKIGKRH